jgi:hypothetical protein
VFVNACGGIRSALFRDEGEEGGGGGGAADSDEKTVSRKQATMIPRRNASDKENNAGRDVDGRLHPSDAKYYVAVRVSSGGGEETIAEADDGHGSGRPTKGRKSKRKRGRPPQKRGMEEEMPRRHSNHVGRRAVHLARYLASTTSECTPVVSRKAHVDKSSFQVSRIFQWSPITLRSPAKKTRKTLDDVSSLRRAVGAGDASVTHPSKSGAWSQGVLTMCVFPEDGRVGTFPTATPPKRRTHVRGHMPVFSPIALRSLGDTPTVRHPPREFPQETTVRTPTRDQGGDDPIHLSNCWHTPNSIVGNASFPSSDIDDLIEFLGDEYD